MDTNKKQFYSNHIPINTVLSEEELLRSILTKEAENIEIIEETIKIELQDTESTKNGLVLAEEKTKKASKRANLKQVLLSLKYALSWSQLKRQLNKETLMTITQRHAKKVAIGAGALLLCLSWSTPPPSNQTYVHTTANIVDIIPQKRALIISNYAKDNYISRFSTLAQQEGEKYDIPPSIILALAIANSNFGSSKLAQEGHNHFQITCHHNPLTEGLVGQQEINERCYSHYQSAWTSFRANSLVLTSPIFEELHAVAKNDPQVWVSGLEKMHYPNAEKLMPIIEKHQLTEFDTPT